MAGRHYIITAEEENNINARIPAGWRIRSYFLGRTVGGSGGCRCRATIIGNDVVVIVVVVLALRRHGV
jgi:hypothetical protein